MRERKYQIAAIHIMAILAMMTLLAGGRFGSVMTKPIQAIKLTSRADRLSLARLAQTYAELPLSFEANVGQADRRVKFLTKGSGYKLFFTGDEAVLAFRSLSPNSDRITDSRESKSTTHVHGPQEGPSRIRHQESSASAALRMKLVGAQPAATVSGLGELPGKSNYFIGSDPKKWRTSVPNFSKVKYKEVYPGVDLIYYGNQGQLEYDFVVAPGADPNQITLEFLTESLPLPSLRTSEGEDRRRTVRGGRQLKIDGNGDLVVATVGGEIRFHRPVSYQATSAGLREPGENGQRTPAQTHYVLVGDNRARFQVDAYDSSLPLTIDPVLSYSTYLGGSNNDYGNAIAVDGYGNVYVTGNTYSTDFPTVSPLQAAKHSGWDAFVAKLNPSGTALVYSTYLGGAGTDYSEGIAVDASGNAYVIGFTTSPNFPTANPLQPTNHGAGDAFVAKLNASGSALVYSTYLGGTARDHGRSIAVDGTGNAYVTGYTASVNFPTANPLQPANHGGPSWCPCDGFVAKLNAKGSALIYSTYLGGSSDDGPHGIAVDGFGNAYVTGETYSTDFPTVNPIQPALHGNQDVFVFKLNASGSALVYSTYLGGKQADFGYDIAVNSSGSAYVTGFTESADFPTVNPLQPKKKGGQDAFVARLNAAGSALVYSTYLGGTNDDEGVGIRVDGSGNAYVTGYTLSTDFPTANALQVTNHGGADAFVAELNADGSALTYSTYFGGSGNDYGRRIAVDSLGNVYWTGRTLSSDFPTANPLQATNHGLYDAFLVKSAPTSGP
jgi:hypothetical protein